MSKETSEFFKVESIDYDYGKEAETKWKEFARFSFYKWIEEIQKRFWHNDYPKNWKSSWLAFYAENDLLKVMDYTQKVRRDGRKTHELILSYDKEKDVFNLKEILGVEEKVWKDIDDEEVLKFLDKIKDKVETKTNWLAMNKTKESVSKAISEMFNDKKNRIFKF